ncbi:MAG: hypothetical protein P1U85_15675 [Verrucomicrobiales bacterium]|nr:hypothetical protein [Verrucomicrobiales bacterium]
MLATIGTILAIAGFIALLVFWIMTLVKQFKSGDTLWGVLSIFFGILAPIWCFMNGHKSLGMKFIIALIVYIVGFALGGAGAVMSMPEMAP